MQEIPDFDTDLVLGLFDSFDYQRPRKLLLTVSWSRACTCLSYCFCGISDIRQNGFRLLTSHVRQIRARRTLTTPHNILRCDRGCSFCSSRYNKIYPFRHPRHAQVEHLCHNDSNKQTQQLQRIPFHTTNKATATMDDSSQSTGYTDEYTSMELSTVLSTGSVVEIEKSLLAKTREVRKVCLAREEVRLISLNIHSLTIFLFVFVGTQYRICRDTGIATAEALFRW